MEQKNIQVEVQGKNVLPTPIKNLRELTAELSETEEHLEGVEILANSANGKADKLGELVGDKYYDASPSGKGKGMGRINLPMNKVYNHNILTQDMIQYPNTIYKIQYDYEIGDVGVINLTEGYESMIIDNINYFYRELGLKAGETLNVITAGGCILRYDSYQWVLVDGTTYTAAGDETVRVGAIAYQLDVVDYYKLGGEITIPENCVLEFEGGSISGGTLVGNGTKIKAGIVKIFNTDIILSGTWNVAEAYPEWFGARKNDSQFDNRLSINSCLKYFQNCLLTGAYYVLSKDNEDNCIIVPKGKKLYSNKSIHTYDLQATSIHGIIANISNSPYNIININSGVELSSLYIKDNSNNGVGIYSVGTSRLSINDVNIQECKIGLYTEAYLSSFVKVIAAKCKTGFYFSHNVSADIMNTTLFVNNCGAFECDNCGFRFEKITYSTIINSGCDYCGYNQYSPETYLGSYYIKNCQNIVFTGCGCENSVQMFNIQDSNNINIFATTYANYNIITTRGADVEKYIYIKFCTKVTLKLYVQDFVNIPDTQQYCYLYDYNHDFAFYTDIPITKIGVHSENDSYNTRIKNSIVSLSSAKQLRNSLIFNADNSNNQPISEFNYGFNRYSNVNGDNILQYKGVKYQLETFIKHTNVNTFHVLDNPFAEDDSCLVDIFNTSYISYFGFAKTQISKNKIYNPDETMLVILSDRISTRVQYKLFTAPDPSEYPYIYYQCDAVNYVALTKIVDDWLTNNMTSFRKSIKTPSSLVYSDRGYIHFSPKYVCPQIWDGTKWVESDGATAGVQRAGLITKRPATSDIPAGFTYVVTTSFDIGGTTYNAGVYAYIGSENWITPEGTTVSDGTLPARS